MQNALRRPFVYGAGTAVFMLVADGFPKIAADDSESISTDFKPVRQVVADRERTNRPPTVMVSVPPCAEETRRLTISFLKREVRQLGNVRLVDSDPDILIHVCPAALVASEERVVNYVVSYVFLPIDRAKYPKAPPLWHDLELGGRDDLQSLCQKVIAVFDTLFLPWVLTREPPAP